MEDRTFHAAGTVTLCASAGIDLRASLDRAASWRHSFAGRRDIDISILDFFLSGGPADPISAEVTRKFITGCMGDPH
jgi:hypothetical protein